MSLLIPLLLPLVAGVVLPLLPRHPPIAKSVAALAALGQLGAALLMARQAPADLSLPWVPQLGLALELGLDGLSTPLVLLTALLTAMAVLATPDDQPRSRLFFALLLSIDVGLCTAFLARNALLFVFASELSLIPVTLLVATFGMQQRASAAVRYLIFNAISGVTLLGVVLAMGWLQSPGPSFAFADLAQQQLDPGTQRWLLALLLLAFGIKMPLPPLHDWQPRTYAQAPIPVAMLLAGAVSKVGAYGLLRFGVQFLPECWASWSPWIAALGAAAALYGALNAIAQAEMRRLAAFSSLGHMGLLTLALAAATPLSLQGVVVQMVAHGLIVALLFCLIGLIENRTGTTTIAELSGLLNPYRGLPFTMGLMLVALMASAGVPGLAGFVAELLVFQGSWGVFPWPTLLCLVASGFTAVYAVRLFNRVGFGRLDNARADWGLTTWSERCPAVVLSALVIAAGIWPGLITGFSEGATATLALRPMALQLLP